MIRHCIKLRAPVSSISLTSTIKSKTKTNVHIFAMFLFYNIQNIALVKVQFFPED
jgi:hypothetical protein